MDNRFHVRYDEGADVLYVTTDGFAGSYGDEDAPGVFWRYRNSDNVLVGVTVLDYSSYWRPRILSLTEQFSNHFHVPRQMAEDVLASVHG